MRDNSILLRSPNKVADFCQRKRKYLHITLSYVAVADNLVPDAV